MLDLYYIHYSAPCRAVLLTAKMLNVDLNLKIINLERRENYSAEFMKINPQHKVPVLVDDGFILAESRAIMIYLVEKYSANNALYPEDVKTRAVINHRLYFDIGTVYLRLVQYYLPIWKTNSPPDPYKAAKLEEALGYMDYYLQDRDYFVGDHITLADVSLAATVSLMLECKVDLKYDSVKRWYERMMRNAPGFKEAITDNAIDVTKLTKF